LILKRKGKEMPKGSQAVDISAEDFDNFIYNFHEEEDISFQRFSFLGVEGNELVYAVRISHPDKQQLSLKIYTSIRPSGKSKDYGTDAIRFVLFWRWDVNSKPRIIKKWSRCNRVKNWKINVKKKLISILEQLKGDNIAFLIKTCPNCGAIINPTKGKGCIEKCS
jgi:hypothetical protein